MCRSWTLVLALYPFGPLCFNLAFIPYVPTIYYVFQIPFIAMYRKEECPSLLKDPEQLETDDGNQDRSEKTPTLKWHKVSNLVMGVASRSQLLMMPCTRLKHGKYNE